MNLDPIEAATPRSDPSARHPTARVAAAVLVAWLGLGCTEANEETQVQEQTQEQSDTGQTYRYLDREASVCHAQSPINILTDGVIDGEHRLLMHYGDTAEQVENLGHTVQVDVLGEQTAELDGQTYRLAQFHFHTPSEHLIDGSAHPMELHLVHRQVDDPERVLVVAVLFEEGPPSPFLAEFSDVIPALQGGRSPVGHLRLSDLVSSEESYFTYHGSMTTAPFQEVVTWLVTRAAHSATPEQIQYIARIEGNNARHVQVTYGRTIEGT